LKGGVIDEMMQWRSRRDLYKIRFKIRTALEECFEMEPELDPNWVAVLDAIDGMRRRGEVPTSDDLPAGVEVIDQMLNGRWITGVVIRSKGTPSKERIIRIDLTSQGRKALAERREQNSDKPKD
jgi:hypothetical protein